MNCKPSHSLVFAAVAAVSLAASAQNTPSYITRVIQALQICRADTPAMKSAAEEAARRIVNGGALWVAGQPSMVSELTSRAGGFIQINPLGARTPAAGDVVLFFEDNSSAPPDTSSGAYRIAFGPDATSPGKPYFSNHAAACGVSPTLANAIPGWVFTGELAAALTRLGKMPAIYESIGMYGAGERNNQLRQAGDFFHPASSVTPIEHGKIADAYLDAIEAMLRRVERDEAADIGRAAAWAAEAKKNGKPLFMYSLGHLFPSEIGDTAIGKLFTSGEYLAGFRSAPLPRDPIPAGAFVAHIGYQHPPDALLRAARAANARVAYISLRPDRDYANDPGVIWIDPMWPWSDACAPLDGYEVPILASSGIVNGAIAWEIYEQTQAKSGAE